MNSNMIISVRIVELKWSGMSDLIRRGDVLDALIEKGQKSKRYEWGDRWELNLFEIKEAVESVPAVEPERKKGKWKVQPSLDGDRPFIWWKCSVCGQVIYSETERDRREFHAFCGRCGADMRGE